MVWFQEDRVSEIGHEAETRDSILTMHTCFLIKSLSQREDHIRDIAENLLNQLRDKFPQVNFQQYVINMLTCICNYLPNVSLPFFLTSAIYLRLMVSLQVLWDSSCIDSLLFSFNGDSSTAVINDPAWTATVRTLYQRIVREWIIKSVSSAPCTSQGLLQVELICFIDENQYLKFL